MKIDAGLATDLGPAAGAAADAEAAGYDGLWTAETSHDPFFPLVLAAGSTSRIELGTSIAVAFSRNPMILANIGYDLQLHSQGRFNLGLGSQVKPHIEKRFSMPWSHPAARMREMILAMKAIWASWNDGSKLDFRGDFYSHTLMTPFFSPGPNPYGGPKIFLAGVGEMMTEVAGEVAEGFFAHAFLTESYLREVIVPALERGRAASGNEGDGFQISVPPFVVTGHTQKEMDAEATITRQRIAFYASTPAYRPVLEHHNVGDLQTEANRLSKLGQWEAMGDLIDDEVLGLFAVVGEPAELPELLVQRFGGVADRLSLGLPGLTAEERMAVVTGVRDIVSAQPA
jgi:probable F420-dependent oxidoreductase